MHICRSDPRNFIKREVRRRPHGIRKSIDLYFVATVVSIRQRLRDDIACYAINFMRLGPRSDRCVGCLHKGRQIAPCSSVKILR